MKKIVIYNLLFCIVTVLFLSGCTIDSKPELTPKIESTQTVESPPNEPMSPPVQPIQFDSLNAAIDFINKNDLNEYREEERFKYSEMISTIKKMNFLPIISFNNGGGVDDFKIERVSLLPMQKYEDVGISYIFSYHGNNYYIVYYFVNDKYASKLSHKESINSYMSYREKRFGAKLSFQASEKQNIQYGENNIEAIIKETDGKIHFVHDEKLYAKINTKNVNDAINMLENINVSYRSLN